jgi:hypothetical protein
MYQRHPQIEEAPLSGETMLFDPAQGRFFVLNRTMATIWRRCDGEHDFDGLLDVMRSEFEGAEPSLLVQDLRSALQELATLGLITPSATGPAAGTSASSEH